MQRTRFKNEIVSEFLIPEGGADKVVIIASGAPTYPGKGGNIDLAKFLVKRGFAVFIPRYRGTWESDGEFLKQELQQDIFDILDELPKGFVDLWTHEEHNIDPKFVAVIGGSFGGPAAFFAAKDPRVSVVIAVCPVVDWTAESLDEPFDILVHFTEKAFGGAYRVSPETWEKLEKGEIYNPVSHVTELKKYADKIWIVHTMEDRSVLPEPVLNFAKELDCKITSLKKGGHSGASLLMKWSLRRKMLKYLR